MAKNKHGMQNPTMESTIAVGRRRLSDITNTGVPLGSGLAGTCESMLSTPLSKGNTAHLLKEIGLLKKLLAEKEATIESQTREMKKLWFNWCRASQQNRQLVKTNGEIFKELAFDREKLRLLQHEYKQMSAMFKVKRAELELKANELSQQLQSMQESKVKESGQNQDVQPVQLKLTSSTESKDSSTCISGTFSVQTCFYQQCSRFDQKFTMTGNTFNEPANEELSSDKRTCLRRRSAKISYKEPSLHKKLRQQEQTVLSDVTSSANGCHAAYFNGLETLEKVCEDEVLDVTCRPESEAMLQDLPASEEFQDPPDPRAPCPDLENSFSPTVKSAVKGKAMRVKLEQQELEQQEEHAPPHGSGLSAALEATQLSRRSSTGRPMRKAAEIVTSYKEIPLKVKLRRPA